MGCWVSRAIAGRYLKVLNARNEKNNQHMTQLQDIFCPVSSSVRFDTFLCAIVSCASFSLYRLYVSISEIRKYICMYLHGFPSLEGMECPLSRSRVSESNIFAIEGGGEIFAIYYLSLDIYNLTWRDVFVSHTHAYRRRQVQGQFGRGCRECERRGIIKNFVRGDFVCFCMC